jgi:AbrB family looped-hinge helix DNA binding protein
LIQCITRSDGAFPAARERNSGVREFAASVTRRGQVTIPAEARRHLGLKPPGKVKFVLGEEGTVTLKPLTSTAIALSGIVPPFSDNDPGDFEALIAVAMDDETDRIVAKMRRLSSRGVPDRRDA